MLNNPIQRLLVALAGGAVLVATVALAANVSATNPYHDSTATSGRLEKGCRAFELTGMRLITTCNKVSATGITEFHDYTDIHSDVSEGCGDWQYIKPKSDGVTIGYKCKQTKDKVIEADLNDVVWWDPTNGQTHMK